MASASRVMTASDLVRRFGTRDPFAIADALGIQVRRRTDLTRQKGFFALVMNIGFIFINASLSDEMQRIVCAHELGHALLHRDLLRDRLVFLEWELFDIKDSTEFEANRFAAELLIDESEMLDCFRNGFDAVQTSQALGININLLMIRLYDMQKASGRDFDLPYIPRRGFLGTIDDSADSV